MKGKAYGADIRRFMLGFVLAGLLVAALGLAVVAVLGNRTPPTRTVPTISQQTGQEQPSEGTSATAAPFAQETVPGAVGTIEETVNPATAAAWATAEMQGI